MPCKDVSSTHPEYVPAQGFSETGYRIVMNCNSDAGQTVFQVHLHLLAGAPLGRFGATP
jgi:histidine triad (HIT) family protein